MKYKGMVCCARRDGVSEECEHWRTCAFYREDPSDYDDEQVHDKLCSTDKYEHYERLGQIKNKLKE